MTLTKRLFRLGFRNYYNEAATGAAAGTTGAAAAEVPVVTSNNGAANNGTPASDDPMVKLGFTKEQQEFFNRKLADERRMLQQQNAKTVDELKKLQQASGTTEQQKKELQNRIEELQRQHMSKEELQKQEQERREREYQETLKTARTDADTWRNRYHESQITRALQDGAIEQDAFSPSQIIDMLYPKTKLVEELDADNKPTGAFVPRVHLVETDAEGQVRTLDLTVGEALKKMKGTPERFGNLFKSTLASGLGQTGSAANANGRRAVDPAKMSPEQWAKLRKEDPEFKTVGK